MHNTAFKPCLVKVSSGLFAKLYSSKEFFKKRAFFFLPKMEIDILKNIFFIKRYPPPPFHTQNEILLPKSRGGGGGSRICRNVPQLNFEYH